MAQADRKFTRDIAIFSVAVINPLTGNPGTPVTYLGTIRNTRVVRQVEEMESRAAKDVGRYYKAGAFESTVTASHAVEGNGVLVSLVGFHVQLVLKEHEDTGAGTYTFVGLVSTATHDFAENGAQSEDYTIHGGTMTKA